MIDGSYGNNLANPYADQPGGATLYLGVIVWSFGKNGNLGVDRQRRVRQLLPQKVVV
jgi:hypothetical protein